MWSNMFSGPKFTFWQKLVWWFDVRKLLLVTLHWRHNDHDSVSNHQPHGCLLNRIQTQIIVNIKAPRHWSFCGEFTGTGEFPAQRANYAENVSTWWRHHGWWLFIPIFDIFWERKNHQRCFVVITKPELMLINMFSPKFAPDLMTWTWVIAQEFQNQRPHLMVHYAHIQWGRTSMMELVWDLRTINVFATCENDPRKNAVLLVLTKIFNVRSWKTH